MDRTRILRAERILEYFVALSPIDTITSKDAKKAAIRSLLLDLRHYCKQEHIDIDPLEAGASNDFDSWERLGEMPAAVCDICGGPSH